jgi:hypothetical protein
MSAELLTARHCVQVELGRGGMGVVCLGQDLLLDRRVAAEVLTLQAVNGCCAQPGPPPNSTTPRSCRSSTPGSLPAWPAS